MAAPMVIQRTGAGLPTATFSRIRVIVADETGEFCDDGQSGKVWYLAGTFGGPVERTCTIPKKKYLFFPLSTAG